MRAAGLVVGETLELLTRPSRPGSPPSSSTRIAEEHIRGRRRDPVVPRATTAFPATICARSTTRSCTASRARGCCSEGDIDLDRLRRDRRRLARRRRRSRSRSARCARRAAELSEVTEDALWRGIAAVRLGGRLTDIGARGRESSVRRSGGYGIVEEYVGHGIGTEMHMDPTSPTTAARAAGRELRRRAWCWRSSRWSTSAAAHPAARRRVDRGHRRTAAGRRTSSTPSRHPRGPGCSRRSTAARPGWRPRGSALSCGLTRSPAGGRGRP